MNSKTIIWVSVLVFSTIGGYIPVALGLDIFSVWAILGSTLGGIIGIFAGVQISKFVG